MSVPPQVETGGFTLIVTVTIQPDMYDEWMRHSWDVFKHVTAEPDCLSFEMFTVPGEEKKVKWVESWSRSLESVKADLGNKEYMRSYKEVTKPMLIGEPQWELMKRFGVYMGRDFVLNALLAAAAVVIIAHKVLNSQIQSLCHYASTPESSRTFTITTTPEKRDLSD